jgi:hypothetical protein
MNPSQPSKRRRAARLAPEALEARELLTGGAGSTFAIVTGSITKANQPAAVTFTIDPSHFTIPKGKFTVGIDVAPASGATISPQIIAVKSATGAALPITHSSYSANLTSVTAGAPTTAVLAQVQLDHKNPNGSVTYTVDVRGAKGTTGQFLLGFYLPGDTNGDGTVNATDIQTIESEMNSNASQTNTKYTFDADANRDGRITKTDLHIAELNQGVATTIIPLASANLDPTFETMPGSQAVTVNTAHFTGMVSPNATVTFQNASNTKSAPVSATADTKGDYSISVPLILGSNTINVTTHDAFGQSISGTLSPVSYVIPVPAPTNKSTTPAASTTSTTATSTPATSASTTTSAQTAAVADIAATTPVTDQATAPATTTTTTANG